LRTSKRQKRTNEPKVEAQAKRVKRVQTVRRDMAKTLQKKWRSTPHRDIDWLACCGFFADRACRMACRSRKISAYRTPSGLLVD
jgi:hypothetical protein